MTQASADCPPANAAAARRKYGLAERRMMAAKPLARLVLLGVVLFGVPGCTTVSSGVKPRPSDAPIAFLLMGQSNMSGRGATTDPAALMIEPDPRIKMLGNDGVIAMAREPIDSPVGQIDAVSVDRAAGVGPGLSFAKNLIARQPGRHILLVPCAKGGSAIAAWRTDRDRTTLYGSCLARAQAAARDARIGGILWYQGESDAESLTLVGAWPSALSRLVRDLRRDLGQPHLPVIAVAIGDRPTKGSYGSRFPAWAAMQRAQRAIRGRCLDVVSAAGLPRNADGLHLSTTGEVALGAKLATAWIKIEQHC
ncbi:MAG: hypothetical protein B7Y43_03935 [Sphingomonas sp. 28-62-20]|uniref:sialate O-acetylesterase n=1 Tax=Sphingomonas sp. 28-62-20 TaxID=1970433 RepID=UPI000BC3E088|nr:MAG: hypothetical protein B7Y43_03935 [Sphingomonas sp. 28-62-20]